MNATLYLDGRSLKNVDSNDLQQVAEIREKQVREIREEVTRKDAPSEGVHTFLTRKNSWEKSLPSPIQSANVAPKTHSTLKSGNNLRHRQITVVQQFEGVVEEVDRDSVITRLVDLTHADFDEEFAELPLHQFSASDQSQLRVGSVFYWVVGIETTPDKQAINYSMLRLARSKPWDRDDLSRIKRAAAVMRARVANDQHSAGE